MSRGALEHWDLVVVGAGPAGSAAALGALTEDPGLDPDVVAALERAAERHGVLETAGRHWLVRAKVGERSHVDSGVGPRASMATMAAGLALEVADASWITRHDHPEDRLGL